MLAISELENKILKKYGLEIDAEAEINDALSDIEDVMLNIGFDDDDEINDSGRELERVYDALFDNN
ncbi:MAG: hypothetical protein FWG24_03990 [Eggerthellaceae bacterium]|nr:hypothetical protein [Eggerthellaceae bacterium]